MKKRKILITAALPYANGEPHLGNILEMIQTDIFVRFQRSRGHCCYFVCGSDVHGTPIMLNAQKRGITPEALVADIQQKQRQDFADFAISFDNYHTTHSKENAKLAEFVYLQLQQRGDISSHYIEQAYDEQKQMFLPDRFIKGECPKCHTADQYGDNCEACGATYAPTDLINPVSVLSGNPPIRKQSEHFFFELPHYETFLTAFLKDEKIQPEIRNKMSEWFEQGLKAWDISRDGPYFGFEIPGTSNKYFYVWMDAPIGYMASFKNFCNSHPEITFDSFWHKDSASDTELYHFIGKDIAYFHTLFWPAMLHGAGFRTPTGVFAHGFLTLDGAKMSKSRGTFITVRTYLNYLHPDYLRYYFACKLNAGVSDIDLRLDDFINRVNADLVGKVINIASRNAGFIHKQFNGKLIATIKNDSLLQKGISISKTIANAIESRQYHQAMREVMHYADEVNQYIDAHKPWQLIKDPTQLSIAHEVCSVAINAFKIIMTYLAPIIPSTAQTAQAFLNCPPLTWSNLSNWLFDHAIEQYQPLMNRIDNKKVEAMQEEAKQILTENTNTTNSGLLQSLPIKPEITIDDFMKCDLRLVTITHAEAVPEADKLIKVTVDIGGETRQVFAGIKKYFEPEQLIGKQTLMLVNLKPRKMRFGLSEGMLLVASGEEADGLIMLTPTQTAKAGMVIK